jgi:predicted CopG family antitoxin
MGITVEKTIKISQEAYKRLITIKNKGESLTDVILREIKPNPNPKTIMKLFGTWQGETQEFEKIFGDILNNQRSTETRNPEALDWSA